jgi:hypothetical protein
MVGYSETGNPPVVGEKIAITLTIGCTSKLSAPAWTSGRLPEWEADQEK